MKYLDYQEVINAGANPEELMVYLEVNPDIELTNYNPSETLPTQEPPTSASTPGTLTNTIQPQAPDVVQPFKNPGTVVTQGLNKNPYAYGQGIEGHEGVDLVNDNREVTNPIGGLNVSGYNPSGYGNWQAIIGASPEELAQMSEKDKEEIRKIVGEYIISQPANIRGLNIPGKNISLQAHLKEAAPSAPEIATGSANLKMGGSGGWAPHLHSVFKDTKGEMRDILEVIKSRQ